MDDWKEVLKARLRAGKKFCSCDGFGDEVGGFLIVAGPTVDVDERVVGSVLLQEVIEFGLEVVGVLFVQIGVVDLRDGHATISNG